MWLATGLKTLGAPALAYTLGRAAGLAGDALLAPVVVAALPSAQNVFVYAMRYGRAVALAREVILLTTITSVVVVVVLTAVLG